MSKINILLEKIGTIVSDDLLSSVVGFIRDMKFNKSENTILSYLYDLKNGFQFLKTDLTLSRIKNLTLLEFRTMSTVYRAKNLALTSQQRFTVTWKLFLKYLGSEILSGFKLPKRPSRNPKPMPEDLTNKLTEIPENGNWIDYRNRALWTLMYGSGLRVSEALNLRVSEVDEVVAIKGKGDKIRSVPILVKVIQFIQEYLRMRPYDSDYVFIGMRGEKLTQQTASHVFRLWRDKNQISKQITLHSLRHSFATHLLRRNCPLSAVQKLMGHSSLDVTMQYLSISDDQLKKSYARYIK